MSAIRFCPRCLTSVPFYLTEDLRFGTSFDRFFFGFETIDGLGMVFLSRWSGPRRAFSSRPLTKTVSDQLSGGKWVSTMMPYKNEMCIVFRGNLFEPARDETFEIFVWKFGFFVHLDQVWSKFSAGGSLRKLMTKGCW